MPADPPRTTVPIRPRASWYLLPCALVLAAVVELVVFVILNYGGLWVADDPEGTGSAVAGARIYLVKGHHYFVYPENSAAGPTACAVAAVDRSGPVASRRRTPGARRRPSPWPAAPTATPRRSSHR
jgi:hypothetical protein